MGQDTVSDNEKHAIRDQADELVRRVREGTLPFEGTRRLLQAIIEGDLTVDVLLEKEGGEHRQKKLNLAEKRRAAVEAEFRKRGLAIAVPKPAVSNREFDRRAKLPIPQGLFYRPGNGEATYERIMTAFGQGDHWTVTDEVERSKIDWEPAEKGYWFWAEIPAACPRVRMSWNDLMRAIRSLSLEEYATAWHLHKALTGERLDVVTGCWLRTRFGRGALRAIDDGGQVYVLRLVAECLAIPYDDCGGRAAEVVN